MIEKELTPKQVAGILGKPYKKVLELMATGQIPSVVESGMNKLRRVTTESLLKRYQDRKFRNAIAEFSKPDIDMSNLNKKRNNRVMNFSEGLTMKEFLKLEPTEAKSYLKKIDDGLIPIR